MLKSWATACLKPCKEASNSKLHLNLPSHTAGTSTIAHPPRIGRCLTPVFGVRLIGAASARTRRRAPTTECPRLDELLQLRVRRHLIAIPAVPFPSTLLATHVVRTAICAFPALGTPQALPALPPALPAALLRRIPQVRGSNEFSRHRMTSLPPSSVRGKIGPGVYGCGTLAGRRRKLGCRERGVVRLALPRGWRAIIPTPPRRFRRLGLQEIRWENIAHFQLLLLIGRGMYRRA